MNWKDIFNMILRLLRRRTTAAQPSPTVSPSKRPAPVPAAPKPMATSAPKPAAAIVQPPQAATSPLPSLPTQRYEENRMFITEDQLRQFEQALNGPAPAHDPNWRVTQGLIKLVVMQAQEINNLLAQVEILEQGNAATTRNIISALQQGAQVEAYGNSLSQDEIDSAMKSMNTAIQSYRAGEQILNYAGQALKFAMLFI